ncbi:MAG: T9SS type A sorting domain-containing protein [Thermonemataceae bacterium]|nr:T9SS type A sorting domain-containing protein [Thermonemataceae bacterium]
MRHFLSQQYQNTLLKYKKFKSRFEKNLEVGISKKKRYSLAQRLKRLWGQLSRLEAQLKLAGTAGVLSLALSVAPQNEAKAQNTFKYYPRTLGLSATDFSASSAPTYPTFADLDNDGDKDLILGTYGGDILFYRRGVDDYGAGVYELVSNDSDASPFKDLGFAYGYASPTFADIDNDGDLDMLVGYKYYYEGKVALYKNVNGKFVAFEGSANPFRDVSTFGYLGTGGARPQMLDADNDGDLDLFVSGLESDKYEVVVKYYENEGYNTSVFTERTGVDNPLGHVSIGYNGTVPSGYYYTGYGALTFADADNDGDMDAFVGEKYGYIYEYKNNGDNTFAAGVLRNDLSLSSVTSYASCPALAFEDLDAGVDGNLDAVIGSKYGTALHYAENDGAGAFTITADINAPTVPFDIKNAPSISLDNMAGTASADLDGDGDVDFLTIDFYGQVRHFSNNGDNTLEELTGTAFTAISGLAYIPKIDIADFDGDGNQDVFIADYYSPTIRYFKNDGTTLTEVTGASNPLNVIPIVSVTGLQLVDFDTDGDLDVALGDEVDMKMYVNDGSSFTLATGYANPFEGIVNNPNIVSAYKYTTPRFVDIDGDQDLDIVFGVFNNLDDPTSATNPDFSNTKLTYYLNDGGVYAKVGDTDSPFAGISVARFADPDFADIDGDGDEDLLVGEFAGAARVQYFERAGNTTCARVAEIRREIQVNELYTFNSEEFKDAYDDTPDTQYKDFPKVKIYTTPQFGQLRAAGNLVNPGTEIAYADLGELVYTPNDGYTGLDAFTWAAFDPIGECYSTASYVRFGIGTDVTAINDELNQYVKVYPNPTQNSFQIDVDKALSGAVELKLYNAVGTLLQVYQYDSPSQIEAISLQNQPKGLYILRIASEGKSGAIKVVKQ